MFRLCMGKNKMKMIPVDPPSGTRDFYPDQMRLRNYLFGVFRNTSKLFGFSEYDSPVLENEDLYKRKAGEEITEQMYNFVDKEGARVALRPEMTPSLARMVLGLVPRETGDVSVGLPLKWFSIPQCWRFETTQKGRKREHYQWNVDVVGIENSSAEFELLAILCTALEKLGFTPEDVVINVNSRQLLEKILLDCGVGSDLFAPVCVVIDKRDKLSNEELRLQLSKLGLSEETVDEIEKKSTECKLEDAPELNEVFEMAKAYGIRDFLQFDPSVVRGLAYYTGIVFEVFDRTKKYSTRAICGGGRYDRLLSLYGSKKPIPCCGFGFGDCVIMDILHEKGMIPSELRDSKVDFVVASYSKELRSGACGVAKRLRDEGYTCNLMNEVSKKVGKAFNYADRQGAQRIAFVAPDEFAKGRVVVKDLRLEDKEKRQVEIELTQLTRDSIEKSFT